MEKQRFHFNIIDLVIPILVIGLISLSVYYISNNQVFLSDVNSDTYITLRVNNYDDLMEQKLSKGSEITDSSTGKLIGTIEGYAEVGEHIEITVGCKTTTNTLGIRLLNGERILSGTILECKIEEYVFTGTIIQIR